MNIFLTAPLRGKSKYGEYYKKIYSILNAEGYKVEADHILDHDVHTVHAWDPEYRFDYYLSVIEKIKLCDVFIAELSISTINVVYEICIALELKKNTIVLYIGDQEPKFIDEIDLGLTEERFQVIQYNSSNLKKRLNSAINYAKKSINQRFTLLLPTGILNYLEKVSKSQSIPRAVYIRQLIEKEMRK